MYTVSVDVTWHVAMDHGGVESTSRASIKARSVHSHLCLPGLLLVSAGASDHKLSIIGLSSLISQLEGMQEEMLPYARLLKTHWHAIFQDQTCIQHVISVPFLGFEFHFC